MAVAPGGSGTATDLTNASPYTAGTGVNIKAVAAAGYRFVNWTAPAGGFGNPNVAETTFTTPAQDVAVTANFVANFAPVYYTLTMAVAPGGSGTATDLTNASPYTAGTAVSIRAVAAAGYQFVNWSAPAGTFGSATGATTTFTTPAQNVTITANFVRRYNLTISSTAGGSVTAPGTGTYTYDAGTVVNLVATPASGYRFVNWTGNVGTIGNVNAATTTIIMNGDYTVTANFALVPPSITVLSPNGGGNFLAGSPMTIRWETINYRPSVVNIFLYRSNTIPGGLDYNFVARIGDVAQPNDGIETWEIPSTISSGDNYFIRISLDVLDPPTGLDTFDDSDAPFSIVPPPIPVIFNGNVSDRIDVVFVGSGFPDITSFTQTVLQLIDYNGTSSNGLMSIEPFLSNRTRFNFWVIETLQTFTNTNFRNESTNLVNSIAPFADKKVVLFVTPKIWDNADAWGYDTTEYWIWTDSGGFGSYVTVGTQFLTDSGWPLYVNYYTTGNPITPQILDYNREQVKISFVHEFGHSFGGLFDEYSYNKTAAEDFTGPPTYVPNADYSPCPKWNPSISSYCGAPCGYTDWCRSSFNSIMRDPYSSPAQFNTVSINELLRDINSSPVYGPTSYVLPITYSSGTFIPGNLTVVAAPPPGGSSSQPSTGYTVQISSASGAILYSTKMGVTAVVGAPSPDWFDEDGNQIYFPHEMLHILDPFETRLILPSFSDAKKISMYDPEGMLVFDVHI
jgi:hypothetical protein